MTHISPTVCVAGLDITAMVDALIYDRPVVAMIVKEYANTNASKAIHFRYILDAGVYYESRTTDEAANFVGQFLNRLDDNRDARTRFTREFVRPYGAEISAGTVASKAIEMAARGKSAAEVHQLIRSVKGTQKVAVL